MKNISKFLEKQTKSEETREAIDAKAAEFSVADVRRVLIIGHAAVLIICAVYSAKFFTSKNPGVIGFLTAGAGMVREYMALRFGMAVEKAADRHRTALLCCSAGLTVIAALDASLGWIPAENLTRLEGGIKVYADFLALYALIAQMVTAVFVVQHCDPMADVRKAQARAKVQIQVSNANLVKESEIIRNQGLADQHRIDALSDELSRGRQALEHIRELAHQRSAIRAVISDSDDPEFQNSLADIFGPGRPDADDSLPSAKRGAGFLSGLVTAKTDDNSEGETTPGKGSRR